VTSINENGLGGYKECVLLVSGEDAWSHLKYESGTHRVQRVPETESAGRIHTSAATVAVMPEADEIDVDLDLGECRFDVFRAHGNGGQCVNTTDSAVRLVHIPTGIVISCQDEKSQLKNKDKAIRILRSKLYLLRQMEQQESEAKTRRDQIGSGDRSEKIRTYNFPQGRVTDHRAHLTVYRIDQIMDGDLDQLVKPLIAAEQAEKLAKAAEA
jgi:peptide chain release factor 1